MRFSSRSRMENPKRLPFESMYGVSLINRVSCHILWMLVLKYHHGPFNRRSRLLCTPRAPEMPATGYYGELLATATFFQPRIYKVNAHLICRNIEMDLADMQKAPVPLHYKSWRCMKKQHFFCMHQSWEEIIFLQCNEATTRGICGTLGRSFFHCRQS